MATDYTRFLIKSVVDSLYATLTASSAVSGLPAINVQDRLIRKVYRTANNKQQWVRFRCTGGATGINCVFVGNHNFTKNAIVLWQGNTTSAFSNTPASNPLNTTLSVVTDANGNIIPKICYFYSAAQSYKFWRLLVRDTGNSTANLQIGRVMAGRYVEPTRNLSDGFEIRTIDPSLGRKTAGRQGYWNEKRKYLEFTYRVSLAKAPQLDQLWGIYNTVGMHTPFVLALTPDNRPVDDTIYCHFETNLTYAHRVIDYHDIQEIVFQEKN